VLLGWIGYDLLCRMVGFRDGLLGVLVALLVLLIASAATQLVSGRGAFLLVGAVLATIMSANVFFVIIPGQKRMVAALAHGEAPDPLPGLQGRQRSAHNVGLAARAPIQCRPHRARPATMAAADPAPPALQRFRFDGVELDVASFSLSIDGEPVACSRRVFELLVLLCQAAGRVTSRNDLIDALWPGGQIVSDEALTQVLFRARSVLGPYAARLVTVRGVGVRLDAPISAELVDPRPGNLAIGTSATAVAAPPVAAPETASPTRQPGGPARSAPRAGPALRSAATALVATLTIAAVLFAIWLRPPPLPQPDWIDEGYGLRSGDLLAGEYDTAAHLREALRHEASGERARGLALLEAVHRTDARSPLPAIYLALWNLGSGDRTAAEEWISHARARGAERGSVYLDLMLAYLDAELAQGPDATIHTAGAVLDVRPEAWRMRVARAHLMQLRGMREAALNELRQVAIPTLGHRKRDLVIADRASMGDVDGAQALLDALAGDADRATHSFLSGRVAWSRGDTAAAHAHFHAASDQALTLARIDLHGRALIYAGALEVALDDDENAIATLSRAREVIGGRILADEIDLSLMLAELHAEAGRTTLAARELERALATAPRAVFDHVPTAALFVGWRLHPAAPPARPSDLSPVADALWRAHVALAGDELDTARQALAAALQQGALAGRLADETRWLQWRLGLDVSAEAALDPPYPPLSRVTLRRALRRVLAADATPPRP
jgi:DNA-binding winged helix-turn-helix (wHTH) protein